MFRKKSITVVFLLIIFLLVVSNLYSQSSSGGRGRRPSNYQLTVNANVSNYRVFIDGNAIKGNRVEVEGGKHTVRVTANGYYDWQQNVSVNGNRTVRANLQPREFQLTINSNVKGAKVFINGNPQGMTSYSSDLQPGTYKIRVSEFGYRDFRTTVNLNSNQNIYAELQPAYAKAQVNIPSSILNKRDKGAASKVEVYLDGNRQKGFSFQVNPGQHRIRIETGGFSIEQTFNFKPGQNYTIEPNLGLSIQ